MKLLDQPLKGDISGIQDVQSYSPEYNFTFCVHLKPSYIKIRGFGLIELRQLFLETSRYQHATSKPQPQLQAPKTKIQAIIIQV